MGRLAFKKTFLLLAVFSAMIFIVFSCGGGGGGGDESSGGGTGGGGETVQQGATGTTSMTILKTLVDRAFNFYDFGTAQSGMTGTTGFASQGIFGRLKGVPLSPDELSAQTAIPCDGGGSISVSPDADGSFTITFQNCGFRDTEKGTTMTFDGTMTVTGDMTSGNMNFVFDLAYVETRNSDQVILSQGNVDITYTLTDVSFVTCNDSEEPVTMTMLMNGTFSEVVDEDGDGTTDSDYTTTYNNVRLMVSLEYDIFCEIATMSISISGSMQMVDNSTSQTFDISISDSDPVVVEISAFTTTTSLVTIDGTFTITSPCFNGTVTIATTSPLIYPEDADCPTSGVVVFTGAINSTFTFTETGFTVDTGSDGTIDETHTDCASAFAQTCS
jgi:hypothetical protein